LKWGKRVNIVHREQSKIGEKTTGAHHPTDSFSQKEGGGKLGKHNWRGSAGEEGVEQNGCHAQPNKDTQGRGGKKPLESFPAVRTSD